MQNRTQDFLVRQLTQLANAIRAHLGEFGVVVQKGVHNMVRLIAAAEATDLPAEAIIPLDLLADQFRDTRKRVETVTTQIRKAAEADETMCRLQKMPWIGPITSSVLVATLRDVSAFRTSRDLSAWLGLTPKSYSSGSEGRLGSISRVGNHYIRRLLYLGAVGVLGSAERRVGNDCSGT